ncbi:Endopolyphosphatase [Stygiomarasmius scandens]|uniref:Endopolyphosphatase n=1 Tax=Marasmiellus scandens TaxID=2682957 RepID=A0ABR1K4U4_9AGAR
MSMFGRALVLALAVVHTTWAMPMAEAPAQQVLATSTKPRQLHGRFLQITDMHPDPHYEEGTSVKKACHRKNPKKKKNRAGYYGTAYSDCDSPFRLTNFTLDFLEKNWADDIDFVICKSCFYVFAGRAKVI